ncbi:hypothetical protein CSOJ01_08904 [Colletotrichum sojae]|uniref:Uncharacterized protein n=1 Tax=Colletotrichum sojae TaxID=2175907 RepID=A0A8H6MS76_9PEZI|nr:hypothetical protein CSOJ01_08904 [Colletotrichum sojae]
MSASESYPLESLPSEPDAGKPPSPSPSAASIDPSQVRWLENQRSRGWEVCKIVMRAVATLLCLVVMAIVLAWYADRHSSGYYYWVMPGLSLVGAVPSFLWDLAEFLTICARHGRGITPKALIGVELVLTAFSAFAATWVAIQLQNGDVSSDHAEPLRIVVAQCVFMGVVAFVHFCLFFRACIERRREIRRRRPRVMYIPETGQTVYVVAKPFPKLPTWQSTQTHSFPRSPQSPRQLPPHPLRLEIPKSPDFFPSSPPSSPPAQMGRQVADLPSAVSAAAGIRRKPVPGLPPNLGRGDRDRHLRPNMRPPPDDYVPDEAELERMRRGDAQPQLIMPGDVDLKFATSATGMTPADGNAREGKFRMDKPVMPAFAGESSSLASSRHGGRARSL